MPLTEDQIESPMKYWMQTPEMAVAIPAVIGAALAHGFPERVEYDTDEGIIWINVLDALD